MPRPVVYAGDFEALMNKWADQKTLDGVAHGATFIANGECARLPQELTNVGHTSRWHPGERVIDVAKTLKPGTVIANFVYKDGKPSYPNQHGYHAALFIRAEGYSVVTGKPTRIWMFDQWRGIRPKVPGPRYVDIVTERRVAALGYRPQPCDDAAAFHVVLVP